MEEKIIIDNKDFSVHAVKTESTVVLIIRAAHGILGCTYLSIETANRLLEHVALVSGVKNFDDMLEARVVKVSTAAETAGVKIGMTGREALLKMS